MWAEGTVDARLWGANGFVFQEEKEPSVVRGSGLHREKPEESGEGLVGVRELEQGLGPESRCDGKHLSYVLPASSCLLLGGKDCKDRARVGARRRLGGASCNHPHGRLAVTWIKAVGMGSERSE